MSVKLPSLDARIIKWNLDDLVERNCPICDSIITDDSYIRPDNLTVRRCNRCTAYFVSPAPSGQQLSHFYSTYDENHRRATKVSEKELLRDYERIDPFSDLRIRELSSLLSFRNSRVLDVGFGRAQFLYHLMKLGAIPYGVELDQKSIEFAKYFGIDNVSYGTLADLSEETKYDLIILNDLIEHPLNPMDALLKASKLLERRGLLSIWTPNGDGSIHQEYPTTFRVDLEHMQYLTPETCIYIASELNLKVVHVESLGFPALNGIDKQLISEQNLKTKIKKIIKLLPGFSMMSNIRSKILASKNEELRLGSYHLFCILQKPDY